MASAMNLESTVGFSGTVQSGLCVSVDREHLVYALGDTVVVEKIGGKKQQVFLQGHNGTISCVSVSPSGRFIAAGATTLPNLRAEIIVWSVRTKELLYRLPLHKGRVQGLSFSANDKYLVSIGGPDDGLAAVWDLATGRGIATSPTSSAHGGNALVVACASRDEATFITAGDFSVRIWKIEQGNKNIPVQDVPLRALRRVAQSIAVDADDNFAYIGTTTGDVIQVGLAARIVKGNGPAKALSKINTIVPLRNGDIIVGCQDGHISILTPGTWKSKKTGQTPNGGAVTSLAPRGADPQEIFVGTADSIMYRGQLSDLSLETRSVSFPDAINAVVFPQGSSDLFISCSGNCIRVYHTASTKLLQQITVPPPAQCLSLVLRKDGKGIISGWSDGVIRGYLPESGKEMFSIQNAHAGGVTAVAVTANGARIVSGGPDGLVRVWRVGPSTQTLEGTLKEHRGRINDIHIRPSTEDECLTASADGSVIVWDLGKFTRSQMLMAKCIFKRARYTPKETQILTCGSDHKLHYWEAFDGSLIREIDLSETASLDALDISRDGLSVAIGASDKKLRVVTYDQVDVTHISGGHSGPVSTVAICPNQRYVVTGTETGGIFVWEYPYAL